MLLAAALTLDADSGASQPAQRDDTLPPPAWPNSPFLGTIDGATGKPIPCRCRAIGGTFQLGDILCMRTHLGVQLARCDLVLNNTFWVPLGVPCTLSRRDSRHTAAQ